MNNKSIINKGQELVEELISILNELNDIEIIELLGKGAIDQLLKAIFDPSIDKSDYLNLQEFLLANKWKATLISLIRYAITNNYSFKGILDDGKSCFISSTFVQWYDDGIMFTQGDKRFEGLIGLYRKNKTLSYAVAARDSKEGEKLGPEYFEFIDESEYKQRLKEFPESQISNLDQPINELEILINSTNNNESKYQELLIKYPWILGAKYNKIQRHSKLDDKNIPDFTGIRVKDGYRDIFEIKPPFIKLFCNDGSFSADFHKAWNQAERYLDFSLQESDYLRRKGYRFDNPKCYLILGYKTVPRRNW